MISPELQYQVHQGDSNAFQTLFATCGKEVYLTALDALKNVSDARSAVKQVFLQLQHELSEASGPIDVDARIAALTRDELARRAAHQPDPQPVSAMPLTWEACRANAACAAAPAASEPEPMPMPQAEPPSVPAPCEAPASGQAGPQPSDCAAPPPPPREAFARPRHRRGRFGVTLLWILVILLALLLIWFGLDILMTLRVVPRIDLGYSWFNAHVFQLFGVQP